MLLNLRSLYRLFDYCSVSCYWDHLSIDCLAALLTMNVPLGLEVMSFGLCHQVKSQSIDLSSHLIGMAKGCNFVGVTTVASLENRGGELPSRRKNVDRRTISTFLLQQSSIMYPFDDITFKCQPRRASMHLYLLRNMIPQICAFTPRPLNSPKSRSFSPAQKDPLSFPPFSRSSFTLSPSQLGVISSQRQLNRYNVAPSTISFRSRRAIFGGWESKRYTLILRFETAEAMKVVGVIRLEMCFT